jgi:hypothetical protein
LTKAPDITDPENPIFYKGRPDPRVDAHLKNPVLIVLHWDRELLGGLNYSPMAAVMGQTPEFLKKVGDEYAKFITDLWFHMAAGRHVLIHGYHPPRQVAWDRRSVREYKGSLTQGVQYQGTHFLDQINTVCVDLFFRSYATSRFIFQSRST